MIKIDKGVPMPTGATGRPPNRYPWVGMEIGDSFFVPGRKAATMGGTLASAKKTHGYICRCRTVTEDGVAGVRVWRVA